MTLDREHDTAPEPIDYVEAAWLWMSAGGTHDAADMREDFAKHTIDRLADEAIHAWRNDPGTPIDRARFVAALAALKEELE